MSARTPPTTTRTEPDARFARATAFERRMHAAVGQVVDAPWGRAYLDPALHRCWDRNLMWVFEGAARTDAAALHAEGHRVLGGAGLLHRRVYVEDPLGRRLAPGFAALGYREDRHLVSAFAPDAPAPDPGDVAVEDIGLDEFAAAYDEWLATDPDVSAINDPTTRRHLVDAQRSFGVAGADERILAVRDAGRVVAWAKSWFRDGVAQVEDVVCMHTHRGRGYGRAVTAAATRAALDRDPELLFIVADDDDWPKQLYGRLGYEPTGLRRVFTLG